jgi:hyperosmotically inducible protein
MLRRLFALVVLLGVFAAAVYVWKVRPGALRLPSLGPVERELGDVKITGSVKTALGLTRNLKPLEIRVSTEEGVVTLRGDVPTEALRHEAEAVAAAVPDVRQVVSHLHLLPGSGPVAGDSRSLGETLDDSALEVQVRLALSLRRELAGADLSARAFRHKVTLSGSVPDTARRRVAVETTKATAGVAEVVDDLRVAPPAPTPAEPRARESRD